jgi:hypothetical protein
MIATMNLAGRRVVIAIAALSISAFAAGCGGYGNTTSSSTTTTTTTTEDGGGGGGTTSTTGGGGGTATTEALCSDLDEMKQELNAITNLDPNNVTVQDINQHISKVASTADQLASSAKQAGGEISDKVQADVDQFVNQVKSTQSQNIIQALAAVGPAFASLQSSLNQSVGQLDCG